MPKFLRAFVHLYQDAFRDLPREVWLLCAVFLVNRAGTMVLPFLSLYAIEDLGLSKGQAGFILAAFGLGSVIGSYAGGRLSNRLGPVRLLRWVLVLSGGAFLILGTLRTFPTLAVGIFVVATINDAFRPAAMAAVTDFTPMIRRTRALALVRLAVNLGMSLGPAAGGLLAGIDYRWLFLGDGITCWLAGLVLWFTLGRKEPPGYLQAQAKPGMNEAPEALEEGSPKGITAPRGALRDGPFLAFMALVFLLSTLVFQIVATLPLYYREVYGYTESRIGLLLGLNALLIVLLEMFLVRILEHRDHLRIFGFGCLLMGFGLGLMPFGASLPFVILTIVLWTFGEMVAFPFSNALVAQRAGEGASGEYMGVYTAMFAIAMLIAPAAGLWVYAHLGPRALWLGIGALGPVLLVASYLLAPRFRE
jgi:MFS family permease